MASTTIPVTSSELLARLDERTPGGWSYHDLLHYAEHAAELGIG